MPTMVASAGADAQPSAAASAHPAAAYSSAGKTRCADRSTVTSAPAATSRPASAGTIGARRSSGSASCRIHSLIGPPDSGAGPLCGAGPADDGKGEQHETSTDSMPAPTGVATNDLDELGSRLTSALAVVVPSARTFASHEMKDATELAVGVSSAGFEFDRGRRRYLL